MFIRVNKKIHVSFKWLQLRHGHYSHRKAVERAKLTESRPPIEVLNIKFSLDSE